MAKPSWKAPATERFLEELFGRTTAITNDRCIPPPSGCGGPATKFRSELHRKEYTISGMCQSCQDAFYHDEREETDE